MFYFCIYVYYEKIITVKLVAYQSLYKLILYCMSSGENIYDFLSAAFRCIVNYYLLWSPCCLVSSRLLFCLTET